MFNDNQRTLVIGIGGMGRNVLRAFVPQAICKTLAVDTDEQSLEASSARYNIVIGRGVCFGLGTGRSVAKGKEAAARNLPDIKPYLDYADTVCLIAGLGGGTGSGGIQVIARYAQDLGKKVFCIVSTPFRFEGKTAELIAQEVLGELDHSGIPKTILNNQDVITSGYTGLMADAFNVADKAICQKAIALLSGKQDSTPLGFTIVGG